MELCGGKPSSDEVVLKTRGGDEQRADHRADHAVGLPAATPAALPSPSPPSASPSSSSFRKFRNLLMAKKFETHDNLPVQVLPEGLFIGSLGAATNLAALQQLGISHILCVSGSLALHTLCMTGVFDYPLRFPESFEYLRLNIADLPTIRIADSFPAAFAFIDRAIGGGGKVLVHCYLGKSRSATILLAFLIANRGMSLHDAMAFLRRARPQIQPNSGFLLELQQFETQQQLEQEKPGTPGTKEQ